MANDAPRDRCPNLRVAIRRCSPGHSSDPARLFRADRKAGVPYSLPLPDLGLEGADAGIVPAGTGFRDSSGLSSCSVASWGRGITSRIVQDPRPWRPGRAGDKGNTAKSVPP
jgi:hypothetical protein